MSNNKGFALRDLPHGTRLFLYGFILFILLSLVSGGMAIFTAIGQDQYFVGRFQDRIEREFAHESANLIIDLQNIAISAGSILREVPLAAQLPSPDILNPGTAVNANPALHELLQTARVEYEMDGLILVGPDYQIVPAFAQDDRDVAARDIINELKSTIVVTRATHLTGQTVISQNDASTANMRSLLQPVTPVLLPPFSRSGQYAEGIADSFGTDEELGLAGIATIYTNIAEDELVVRSVLVGLKSVPGRLLEPVARAAEIDDVELVRPSAVDPERSFYPILDYRNREIAQLSWIPTTIGYDIQVWLIGLLAGTLLAVTMGTIASVLIIRGYSRRTADVEQTTYKIVNFDENTGLPNSRLFATIADEKIRDQKFSEKPLAVMVLGIDRYQEMKEGLGPKMAEDIAVTFNKRIFPLLPVRATIARTGADEFTAMIPDLEDREEVEQLQTVIFDANQQPLIVKDAPLRITCCTGAAIAPDHGHTPQQLINNSRLALTYAAQKGYGKSLIYSQDMRESRHNRPLLASELSEAINENLLDVVYQPAILTDCKTVTAVEALVRWRHKEFGSVRPDELIALAELTGQISDLGDWILKRAFSDAAHWKTLKLAVNITPTQLADEGFASRIQKLMTGAGLEPDRVEVEVTEQVFFGNNIAAINTLRQLKDHGVRVALDDFGSGYGSLSHLVDFPFDVIKLDRRLVVNLENSTAAATVLGSVVNMAVSLGTEIVAEGIETARQISFIRLTQCSRMQGYYFSPPLAAKTVLDFREKLMPSAKDTSADAESRALEPV